MYILTTSQIITIGSTPSKLPPIPLEGRKFIGIQNLGGSTVYIAGTMVTADTAGTGGYQLFPKGYWQENYSDNVDVYGVIASGSTQVLCEEGK